MVRESYRICEVMLLGRSASQCELLIHLEPCNLNYSLLWFVRFEV